MRAHPVAITRCIAVWDGEHQSSCTQMDGHPSSKLRRLPHVFSKVLELPFRSVADVLIQESPEFIRFISGIEVDGGDDVSDDVRALAVEIYPGVRKIVVRNGVVGGGGGDEVELPLDKLDVDKWRFRLTGPTRPELSTAVLADGKLIVTVPKVGGGKAQGGREFWRGSRWKGVLERWWPACLCTMNFLGKKKV